MKEVEQALAQMYTLIDNLPQQVAEGLAIAQASDLRPLSREISNVVVSGLGGSGIGGSIVAEFALLQANVPIFVCKDYDLPTFVNNTTLVVACSYSGSTEETLAAVRTALQVGAPVVCISSGGELLAMAASEGLDFIRIPGGQPPRASLGYSLVSLFVALTKKGVFVDSATEALSRVAGLLGNKKEAFKEQGKKLAEGCAGKHVILYAPVGLEAVAVRWRQQINENSKMLCHHHVIPEMNHNELVGWAGGSDQYAVVFLRSTTENPRNATRIGINIEIVRQHTPHVFEVHAEGSGIEELFSMIYIGDWMSYYLAENAGVDPIEIRVINFLKSTLAATQ